MHYLTIFSEIQIVLKVEILSDYRPIRNYEKLLTLLTLKILWSMFLMLVKYMMRKLKSTSMRNFKNGLNYVLYKITNTSSFWLLLDHLHNNPLENSQLSSLWDAKWIQKYEHWYICWILTYIQTMAEINLQRNNIQYESKQNI